MAKSKKKQTPNAANAKNALDSFKMEAATEMGVDLKKGGDLTAKQAGSVGGQMVKKIVEKAENSKKNK